VLQFRLGPERAELRGSAEGSRFAREVFGPGHRIDLPRRVDKRENCLVTSRAAGYPASRQLFSRARTFAGYVWGRFFQFGIALLMRRGHSCPHYPAQPPNPAATGALALA